jgi:3-dehydroquinate synthase
MVLNYGHTFAHGIENTLGYGRLLHGEAVILGIDAALELGRKLGMNSAGLETYRELVEKLMRCVPVRKMDAGHILSAMALDKKRSATDQRYVMLKQAGSPIICENVDRKMVRSALTAMLKRYQTGRGHR